MHPCKALLKVRDDVQGARSSQSGLDSLLVTKSDSESCHGINASAVIIMGKGH